jgi:hypothetical protein
MIVVQAPATTQYEGLAIKSLTLSCFLLPFCPILLRRAGWPTRTTGSARPALR